MRGDTAVKESKQFIWSCTKFIASILCALSTIFWWILGQMLPVLTVVGYAALIIGLLSTCMTYLTEISPALKQEKSENKD